MWHNQQMQQQQRIDETSDIDNNTGNIVDGTHIMFYFTTFYFIFIYIEKNIIIL